MKKIVSLILVLVLAIGVLASCKDDKPVEKSVVIVCEQNSEYADILKAKIEEKTGESIQVVKKSEAGDSFIVSADIIDSGDMNLGDYGWKVGSGRIDFIKGLFVDYETLANAFVNNISNIESIKSVSGQTIKVADGNSIYDSNDEVVSFIDSRANDLRDYVLKSSTKYDSSNINGTIYYVSENGNDSNNGTSPESAWATIDRVNKASLKSGDAVLFECGGLFRGGVKTVSGVTYASYGTGVKPVIIQSVRNYAEGNLWTMEDASRNIWRLTVRVDDPGIIVFDAHQRAIEYVKEDVAKRIWDINGVTETGYSLLEKSTDDKVYYWGTKDTDFLSFNPYGKSYDLYLKSEKDPNTFESIEIGEDIAVFEVGGNMNVTVDGLCLKYSGGCTVSASGTVVYGLTVTNCVFSYSGGSLISSNNMKDSRYGNAIQIFGGCDGFTVENNWIYEIFDTGITFQYHYASGKPKMVNIQISNNLVERCYWCLEWWIAQDSKTAIKDPEVGNVQVSNNILRDGFDSWGTMQHPKPQWGAMLSSGFGTTNLSDFIIENNIFDRTHISSNPEIVTRMLVLSMNNGNKNIEYTNNLFVQHSNQLIGRITYGMSGMTKQYFANKSDISDMISILGDNFYNNFFCVAPKHQ